MQHELQRHWRSGLLNGKSVSYHSSCPQMLYYKLGVVDSINGYGLALLPHVMDLADELEVEMMN